MSSVLEQFILNLPEIYQMLYEHPEWNDAASRNCLPRLKVIIAVYDTLARSLGRSLRILDLGCAQGFYSLSLAGKGASVKGVDFLPQNIALCQILAKEHQNYDVTFVEGRIETVIEELEDAQFDMVIGLNVFHHIVHSHGVDKVQLWLTRLLDCVEIALLELALKEEPLYWGPSQPDSPLTLFKNNAFYQQLTEYPTHLSDIKRPLYLLSNRRLLLGEFCRPFMSWDTRPHNRASNAHHGSRRYFFADDYLCKIYHVSCNSEILTKRELERNAYELQHELAFLSHPPVGFHVARLLASGENQWQGWCVMERLPGVLLDSKLSQLSLLERERVLYQILQQLTVLEKAGLYHDDLRTWNILVDDLLQVRLIDYGSIASKKNYCSWPKDIFQAFIITIGEILRPENVRIPNNRPLMLSPLNLPAPYSNWLYAFCQQKVSIWSFSLLFDLFSRKDTLPVPQETINATDLWIAAGEKWLQQRALHSNHLHNLHREEWAQCVNVLRQEIDIRLVAIQREIAADYQQILSALAAQVVSQQEQCITLQKILATLESSEEGEEYRALDVKQNDDNVQAKMSNEKTIIDHKVWMKQCIQLRQNNQQLYSRSWRIMEPYRYVGLQIKLLYQYGLKQRMKHLVKRCVVGTFIILNNHPKLKGYSINMLHKSGQFERIKGIYHRMYSQKYEVIRDHKEQKNWVLQAPEQRLPAAVHAIFNKLRNK
ncbi:MAG: O-antigen chain terminator bifunctional methyltransferase/kinase WbdD [Sodalis sp. Fse]|nr:MAG: O-antigen chain terminator bifunctional methyltransferase/kinase WbdD [Sodalis sp. Fse]